MQKAQHFPVMFATLIVCSFALGGCSDIANGPDSSSATASAQALDKATSIVTTLRTPVTFILPGGSCGLASDVTGNGTFHYVFRVTINANGVPKISMNWNAHGTASGADGSRYIFNYAFNARNIDPGFTTLPFTFDAVDHFNLIGQGNTPDLRVWVKGHFRVNLDGTIDHLTGSGHGADLSCDPI